jgi:hypothetical protein
MAPSASPAATCCAPRDEQNDIAGLLHLVDQAFHAAFKLPAELGVPDTMAVKSKRKFPFGEAL